MSLFGSPNVEKMLANRDNKGLMKVLSKSKDLNLMKKAINALGQLRDPEAVPTLIEILRYEYFGGGDMLRMDPGDLMKIKMRNNELRAAAASALGSIGDVRALPALRAICEETTVLRFDNSGMLVTAAKDSITTISGGNKPPALTPQPQVQAEPQKPPLPSQAVILPGNYPQWEKVKTDPASLPKRMLSELQKAMVFIVCEDGVEQAAVIARADRSEFHSVVTDSTPMRLHIDFFTGRGGALFGIYPLVMDDPTDPAFKETWMNPYDDLPELGTIDPLSAEQRKRLQLLLSQQYVWMIFINHNNQYLWIRKVAYTSQQLKVFQEYSKKLDQYTGRTIEKTQYFNLLQEYMNAISTETLQRDFVQLFKQR